MPSNLYLDIQPNQWPIVYRKEYNVSFLGMEKLHPFDAAKWGHVFKYLQRAGFINEETVVVPKEPTKEDLLVVHTKKYLKKLNCSLYVARIAEVAPLCLVPNFLVQRSFLRPMRFQTGGSILAGKLALERGWAVNIGGGFHHCSAAKGGGFCAYADITLLIHFVFNHYAERLQNVMIVDLDAHQGNGHARDFKDNPNVYIFDVYNAAIYPFDHAAKKYINKRVELRQFTDDSPYLESISRNLDDAFKEFTPQLVVYNAGTDILKGDSLGRLSVSAQGIIERDELVFRKTRTRKIPIVMLTSGGYLNKSAQIIASSIVNLHRAKLIDNILHT